LPEWDIQTENLDQLVWAFAARYHGLGEILPMNDTGEKNAADVNDDENHHDVCENLMEFIPEVTSAIAPIAAPDFALVVIVVADAQEQLCICATSRRNFLGDGSKRTCVFLNSV